MPMPPLIDEAAPRNPTLDAQLLELFFDRVPMGVAVFDTELRLQRCNKTWPATSSTTWAFRPEYTAQAATSPS